jgi:hypothetical protein
MEPIQFKNSLSLIGLYSLQKLLLHFTIGSKVDYA